MADTRVSVLGGSGYAGGWIVREAASRGLAVTAFSRTAPADPVPGVTYVEADASDDATLDRAVDAEVVIAALSPRGPLAGALEGLYARLAQRAAQIGTRLIIVGGFSALRAAPGAPRFSEGRLDPRFVAEAREMVRVLEALPGFDGLDWTFVSPAELFGSYVPGEALGHYRLGGEVVLATDGGPTAVSGADFALAVVDLIERDERGHVSVAY